MQVGSFSKHLVFETSADKILAPRNVQREYRARYEEHKVLGALPRLEFIAPELQVWTMTVLLSAAHGISPKETLLVARTLIKDGRACPLIIGGVNYGYHVLEKATENWRHGGPDGNPITVQMNLTFKEYVQ